MRVRLLALVAATCGFCQPAAAQDGLVFEPSSPWTLDYDDDSCALRRLFGEGEDQAYLEMRRFAPGLGLQTIIGSKRMNARQPVDFKYRFSSDAEWREATLGNELIMDNGFNGVLFDPSFVSFPEIDALEDPVERAAQYKAVDMRAAEQQAAAKIDSITLRGAFHRQLTLRLGGFAAAISAMNDCVDDLTTHWGIDVEAHKTLTRGATPVNLPEVGRMIDYPPIMLREGVPGMVNIRLAVDETGQVTACHIQMPLADPAFEETSCADIQHELDFDPALDKDGKPIASYWVTKVHFKIGPTSYQ